MAEDRVVRYVREVYDSFKQQRQDQEDIWDLAYDAFMGRYSEANLTKWKALEGHDWRSKVFVRFARRKVISQVSQINDIQFQGGQLPFNITPTEVPESQQGQLMPPQIAQARCRDMKQLIQDTLEEQKYDRTLMASNLEAGIYGMSVHKAPVVRRKQSVNYQMWVPPAARMMDSLFGTRMAGKYGRMQRQENAVMLPFVEHINLWDYFWDMEAVDHQSGIANIHRVMMDAGMLRRLEELPGYDRAAIDRVLSQAGYGESTGSQPGEGPGPARMSKRRRNLEVVNYWGRVPRRDLTEYEHVLAEDTTDGREIEICTTVVYVGGTSSDGIAIYKPQPNPLPLKHRPFHVAYWEGVPHETAGIGIPENLQDSQMMINGFWRCFIDNAALSGNLVRFYKSSAFKPGQDMNIRPGAGYELEDWVTDVRQAVHWVSPPYIGQGMIDALNVAERLGDEESGHPKLMQGEMAKHMPQTAFQTSQLLEAANKQTGNIIKNIDEGHIEPDVEAFYHFLMETHPNENIKGDYCVQATGFSAYNDRIIKGKAVQSLFGLAMSNERTAVMVKVGPNLREIYRLNDLDPDQFMMSEEEEAQMNQQAQMMAEQAALMPPPGREGEMPMGPGGPQGPGQEQPMGKSMIAIPGRQFGGPVEEGKPYVVGEAGPEQFMPEPGPVEKPRSFKEKRWNDLEVYRNPDSYVWVDHPTHSDWYEKGMVQKFARAAKKHGVDPYDYVALGISESGLGNLHPSNPTRINLDVHAKELQDTYGYEYGTDMGEVGSNIDFGAKYMRRQLDKHPNDRMAGLQSYSGEGSSLYGGKEQRYFGKENKNIWRDKPHAARIDDISRRLKKNPEIVDVVMAGLTYDDPPQRDAIHGTAPSMTSAPISRPIPQGMVGTQGPEIIVPERDGVIIPNQEEEDDFRWQP